MIEIEKERERKRQEYISNKIKAIKLQKENRLRNEQQLEQKLGIHEALTKFHEPVTEKLTQQEEGRKQDLKAITNAIEDMSFFIPDLESSRIIEPIEDVKELYQEGKREYLPDLDLDIGYLKSEKLYKPSRLLRDLNEDNIAEMINKATNLRTNFGREIGRIKGQITRAKNLTKEELEQLENKIKENEYKISVLKIYIDRVQKMKGISKIVVGKGDPLAILDKITDKIAEGSKCKKVYNLAVSLLDVLLKDGVITKDFVTKYYRNYLY